MNRVPLGQIAKINPPLSFKVANDAQCTFVPMESLDEVSGTLSRPYVRQVADVQKGYTSFVESDVLFAKITPCMENGKCAIAQNLIDGVGFGSTEFHVVRATEKTLPKWIYYFLRQSSTREKAAQRMTGSAGQQRVPAQFLEEVLVPLPPLFEQEHLTARLAKADRIRRLRRAALAQSESFLQSVFIDLLNQWDSQKQSFVDMGSLVKITGGGTPSRDNPEYFVGSIPWLTSKDMRGEYIFDTEEHISEQAIKESSTNLVPAGSILVVVKSKVLMRRLPLAISMVDLCHGQDVKSIQCSNKVLPEFLLFVIKSNEGNLLAQARGANTEGLTLPMLQEIRVPLVSIKEQQHFANVVRRHEHIRAQQREGLRQAEHLFHSLLHQAFGEEVIQ